MLADMTELGWGLVKLEKAALALLNRVELLVNMLVIESKKGY